MNGKPRRVAGAVFLVGVVLSLAACSGSSQPSATLPIPSGALVVRAIDIKFQPAEQGVPGGQPFKLYFDNADSVAHNVVIAGADGSRILAGDIFTGPLQKVYDVPALSSGTYKLLCDVHPDMTGTLTVPLSSSWTAHRGAPARGLQPDMDHTAATARRPTTLRPRPGPSCRRPPCRR